MSIEHADLDIPGLRIKKELASGGMASVFLATQTAFDRDVALKIMAPELALNKEFQKRFLREAQLVAKLNHSNIVQVYDTGEHKGYFYLSMEYLKGGDLKTPTLYGTDVPDIFTISLCILNALDYAYQQNIVHRDIKPANIMFRSDGTVVLVDFGIARSFDESLTRVTVAGTRMGTPQYMSPEQFEGKDVDHRSDIYAFGVTLYEMLTGNTPFVGKNMNQIWMAHLQEPIPELDKPLKRLQPLIDGALAKNPEDRFQSSGEFAEQLVALESAFPHEPPRNIAGDNVTTEIETGTGAKKVSRPISYYAIKKRTQADRPATNHRRIAIAAGAVLAIGAGSFYLGQSGDIGGSVIPSSQPGAPESESGASPVIETAARTNDSNPQGPDRYVADIPGPTPDADVSNNLTAGLTASAAADVVADDSSSEVPERVINGTGQASAGPAGAVRRPDEAGSLDQTFFSTSSRDDQRTVLANYSRVLSEFPDSARANAGIAQLSAQIERQTVAALENGDLAGARDAIAILESSVHVDPVLTARLLAMYEERRAELQDAGK